MAGKKEKLLPEKNFKWAENKGKVLGVWISTDPNTTLNLNYREKADKIRNVLSCWRYRRLTLMGKILVIKNLGASQLTYILAPLATNHEIIREINDLFCSYLWNNKGDKIRRSVIISEYEKGGLKMVDIATFNKFLKTTWIKKYLDGSNHEKWKEFFDFELRKYGGKLVFNGNLNKRDTLKTTPAQNTFLQELLEIWSEVNFGDQIRNEQQFLEQPIWHNSLIRIEDKPIFYTQLFLCGISKITNLMKVSRNFLSLEELINTYQVRVMPLKYFGLISALRHHYNANFPKEPSDTGKPSAFLETFVKSDKGNRVVYKKLLSSKSSAPVKSQTKWKNLIVCDRWSSDSGVAYGLAARCTKSTKRLNFQYRFLHRILPANVLLTKIGLKQDPNCTFCSNSPESLIHLFWYCMNVETFWEILIERLKESSTEKLSKTDHGISWPEAGHLHLFTSTQFLLSSSKTLCGAARPVTKLHVYNVLLWFLNPSFTLNPIKLEKTQRSGNLYCPFLLLTSPASPAAAHLPVLSSHGPQNIEEAFFSIMTPFPTADDPFTTGCVILSKFRFWSLSVFPPFFYNFL